MNIRFSRTAMAACLTAATVAGALAVTAAPSYADTFGGCRGGYAYIDHGYYVQPCVERNSIDGSMNEQINVSVAPHSTDVLVCGILVPVTGFGSLDGIEHCAYSAKTGSSWSSFPLYWNEHQPLVLDKADYVFEAYIKDGSVTEGDVESPTITLYEP
ncbi:hypothetical protein [Kutzneria chonburiensis]|uniref:Secreted protein n=1 Tax=Kutzneria chonburiensis TaxID=1483604 RepID=A0ABV6MNP3_9PSEU|nr:hypothetical protein [Kutzneria chonburiensis]